MSERRRGHETNAPGMQACRRLRAPCGRGDSMRGRNDVSNATLTVIQFTVYGKPEPAGSKRAFVVPGTSRATVTDDNPKSRDWKNAVASAAVEYCCGSVMELMAGPLIAEFTFYLPRPKGHYGSGKNAMQVKASAPAFPETKPDVLKLSRAVEDALTGIIWRDDAQIVSEKIVKRYGAPSRVEIVVTHVTPTAPIIPQ